MAIFNDHLKGTPAKIFGINLILSETKLESLAYTFVADYLHLSSFILWWASKTYVFWNWLFKVIQGHWFRNESKVHVQLSISHYGTFGPILHFRDTAGFLLQPLFHLNFGGVPIESDRRCWDSRERRSATKWFSKYACQPM